MGNFGKRLMPVVSKSERIDASARSDQELELQRVQDSYKYHKIWAWVWLHFFTFECTVISNTFKNTCVNSPQVWPLNALASNPLDLDYPSVVCILKCSSWTFSLYSVYGKLLLYNQHPHFLWPSMYEWIVMIFIKESK